MPEYTRNDRITLAGIKIQPRIGVTPGERRLPQTCLVDVTLLGDFEAAAATDNLHNTVDYGKVLQQVLEIAHEREFNLMETLAYRLARHILQVFPARRVCVRLRKRPAVLGDKLEHVDVEVEAP